MHDVIWGLCCREKETLKNFLDERKHSAGIAMHWILFGSNHRETRPERGGMLRDYTRCMKKPWNLVKTIANTYFLVDAQGAPHNALFKYEIPLCPPRKLGPTLHGVFCD